jgi:endonuclease-3
VLNRLAQERGELSLDFLKDMPVDEAVAYLRSFPGVGPKTAACVLLFACNQPVLPVDTHVHRVSRRLGLIAERTTAEKAHADLAKLVPRKSVLDFHVHLVWHGRRICKAQRPKCKECVLLEYCPTGPQLIYQRKTG